MGSSRQNRPHPSVYQATAGPCTYIHTSYPLVVTDDRNRLRCVTYLSVSMSQRAEIILSPSIAINSRCHDKTWVIRGQRAVGVSVRFAEWQWEMGDALLASALYDRGVGRVGPSRCKDLHLTYRYHPSHGVLQAQRPPEAMLWRLYVRRWLHVSLKF